MRENKKRQQILNVLAKSIRAIIENEELDFEKLEEIRLRIDQPLIVEYENVEMLLPQCIIFVNIRCMHTNRN